MSFLKKWRRIRGLGLVILTLLFGLGHSAYSSNNRDLFLYNTHTKETIRVTFKRNGQYDREGLRKLNRFFRDWRNGKAARMDPKLFDVMWEVYRKTKASAPMHIVSGYRSPETNEMLRRHSSKVAKQSQHTRGKAVDFFIPGVSTAQLQALGLKLEAGGVGYYPKSASPFVHLDTGSVRHWPRMSRHELAKIFPNGNTAHIPSDGRPLAKRGKTSPAKTDKSPRIATGQVEGNEADATQRSFPALLASLFFPASDESNNTSQGVRQSTDSTPISADTPKNQSRDSASRQSAGDQQADVIVQPARRPNNIIDTDDVNSEGLADLIQEMVLPLPKPNRGISPLPNSTDSPGNDGNASLLAFLDLEPAKRPDSAIDAINRAIGSSENIGDAALGNMERTKPPQTIAALALSPTTSYGNAPDIRKNKLSDPVKGKQIAGIILVPANPSEPYRSGQANGISKRLYLDAQRLRSSQFAQLTHPNQNTLFSPAAFHLTSRWLAKLENPSQSGQTGRFLKSRVAPLIQFAQDAQGMRPANTYSVSTPATDSVKSINANGLGQGI